MNSLLRTIVQISRPSLTTQFQLLAKQRKASRAAVGSWRCFSEAAHSSADKRNQEVEAALSSPDVETEYHKEIQEITTERLEKKRNKHSIVGLVTSTKCAKSITVTYHVPRYNKKYQVTISKRRRIMAHDEEEICHDGDLVRVVPCLPKSRKKRHRILEIIKKTPTFDLKKFEEFQAARRAPGAPSASASAGASSNSSAESS